MKPVLILLSILMLGLLVSPAGADVYSWVDADGIRHFSNTPPPDTTPGVVAVSEQAHDAFADDQRTAMDRKTMERIDNEQRPQGEKGEPVSKGPAGQTGAQEVAKEVPVIPESTASTKKNPFPEAACQGCGPRQSGAIAGQPYNGCSLVRFFSTQKATLISAGLLADCQLPYH